MIFRENVTMQWACNICGYVHDDDDLPEMCPVCGAPKSKFSQRYEDEGDVFGDEYGREEVDDVGSDYYGDNDE